MQKENTKQRAGDNDERGEWLLRYSPMVVEDLSCTLRLILQSLLLILHMVVGSTSLPQLQDFCLGGIAQDLNGLLLVNNHLQSSMWLELHC